MLPSVHHIDLHRAQKGLLRAVASIEFTKGILAILVGVIAILLVRKDAWVLAESLLALLHISTDRKSAQLFLDFADSLTDSRLWIAAEFAFAYSALRFAEAYGLWKQRTWGEWIAFLSGMLFVPVEIRELAHGITILRSLVFVINLGIILYMGFLLRDERRHRRERRRALLETLDQSGK